MDINVNVDVDVESLKYSWSQAYSLVTDILPILSSITVSSSLTISVQTYPVTLEWRPG